MKPGMNVDIDSLHLTLPFGNRSERVQTPRYHWNNVTRGQGAPFVIIQWTLEGRGGFELGGQTWSVEAGKAFIAILPEQGSYFFPKNATEPWTFAWVNFYGALAVSLCQAFRKMYSPVMPLARGSSASARFLELAQWGETRAMRDPHEVSAACYAFLMEWARQLDPDVRLARDPVERAIEVCRMRFREPIGVKQLAAESGLTREHFTRRFTQQAGKPPAEFLCDLRRAAAKSMLAEKAATLKEIALRCGFPSVKSLRRAMS